MNYLEILEKLYSLNVTKSPHLGLSSIRQLTENHGNPQNSYPSVLVAGSNGKGSTTAKIAEALRLAGYRVGLYTSPHISTFRERIQVDGKMIEEEEIVEMMPRLFAFGSQATYFELVTALAFAYFCKKEVEIAILEVGLGGRLDATNVVDPILSIITSISLEHSHILGDTEELICREKAGIARPGVPLVVGPEVPLKPLEPFEDDLYIVPSCSPEEDINKSIAAKGLEILQERFPFPREALQQGLKKRPPCRYEIFKERFILDVAHNPASLQRLAASLQHPAVWVVSLSHGKDVLACLKTIQNKVSHLILTQGNHPRCLESEELEKTWQELSNDIPYTLTKNVAEAIAKAEEQTHSLVIVAGTFFMMAEAREALGCSFPRDPYEMNEHQVLDFEKLKHKDAR